jgi:signal transducer and activator of transcription 5B
LLLLLLPGGYLGSFGVRNEEERTYCVCVCSPLEFTSAKVAMAQWEKCMRLNGQFLEQLKSLYGHRLPIEVRHYLANWMEAQSWSEVDPDSPNQEADARRLFEGMLQALSDLMARHTQNFITKTQLEALYIHMRNEYVSQPLGLVRVVQHILFKEAELIDQQEHLQAPSPLPQTPSQKSQVQQILQNIVGKTEAIEATFRNLSSKLENFKVQYHEAFQLDSVLRQGNRIPPEQVAKCKERKQLLDQICNRDADAMKRTCVEMHQRSLDTLGQIRTVQNMMGIELRNWKQTQRMFITDDDRGKTELNSIQQWFETLAESLWRNRQVSKQLPTILPQNLIAGDQFMSLTHQFTQQLLIVIQLSFVLEKQPPQVIKTANRFSSTVRLLVGSKLQIHLGFPEVQVSIINEKQAKTVDADPCKPVPPSFSSGEILNYQKSMEFNATTGILSCAFNFMQLRRIKRNSDKKASEMVTEEKFALLFKTHFTIGGELEATLNTLSLPVVVIVHVTQQPPAEATIFWDNSFAASDRDPFVIPESVPWSRLSEALNCYFHANTGRGLTPPNLDYLGRKLLGVGSEEDLSQSQITRTQLCRDQLRGRNFTFWEWFYKHLDLIKTTLKREWTEGSIQGFMQRTDAEKMLLQSLNGTFLIRFSEGDPGGISVAWVNDGDSINSDRQVLSLAPWNKHVLGIRSLADRSDTPRV